MKKIKMFMGAVLCMNLLTLSGCDRIVQSAVVEEKDQTEQKKEEKKETVQKIVAEQVQAPETYQTTIQADLRSADREDKETPMNFTLTTDAQGWEDEISIDELTQVFFDYDAGQILKEHEYLKDIVPAGPIYISEEV